jgi:hypothetical protein
MEYPIVDRHYSETPQSCPDCPNKHHSLYTIGDDRVARCFVCMSIEWHRTRAQRWAEQEMRNAAEDNQPARQPTSI